MVLEVMEMGRHKERVKLLVRNVVQQELVHHVVAIRIHVLLVPVHVGQLPHVEEECWIISVQVVPVNVDRKMRALREVH